MCSRPIGAHVQEARVGSLLEMIECLSFLPPPLLLWQELPAVFEARSAHSCPFSGLFPEAAHAGGSCGASSLSVDVVILQWWAGVPHEK